MGVHGERHGGSEMVGNFFLLWNPGVLPHFLLVLPLYVLMVMVMVILILIGKKKLIVGVLPP